MKGPGLRIEMEVRRVWRCPRCGRVSRRAGEIVAQRCPCAEDGTWMKLEGQPPRRTFPRPPPIPRDPADEEDASMSSGDVADAASVGGTADAGSICHDDSGSPIPQSTDAPKPASDAPPAME